MVNMKDEYGLEIDPEDKKYLRMIHLIARKYPINARCGYEDYLSVGIAALADARGKYDATRKAKFITFAYHCIKNAIEKEFQRNHNLVSGCIPYHIQGDKKAEDKIRFLNATTVSLSISRKEIQDAGLAPPVRNKRFRPAFKDIIMESGLDNPRNNAERLEIKEKMTEMIATLEDDEQDIIYRRVFQGDTFQQIADAKEMTWRAVNYQFHHALETLKRRCTVAGLDIYA